MSDTDRPALDGSPAGEPTGEPVKGRNRPRAALIVALFLLVYIPSAFNWFSSRTVRTDILRDGTLSESLYTKALVVRDEEPILAGKAGVSVSAVNEGDRVAGNSVVATVYDAMTVDSLEQLKRAGRRLLEGQYAAQSRAPVYSQKVESIDYEITGAVNKLLPAVNRNALPEASALADAIGGLMIKRAEAYGALATDDAGVAAVKDEIRGIEEQVAQTGVGVYCTSPGYLSFGVDGMETELSPQGIENLTSARFNEIVGKSGGATPAAEENPYGGAEVYGGEPIAKVVKGNTFLLVIGVPEGYHTRYAAGDRIRIRVDAPEYEFESAEVAAVYDGGGGADTVDFVVVSLSKYLYDFLTARVVDVTIVEKYQEGLKVPQKCLRDIDEDMSGGYIVLVKGSQASVRHVRILASNGVYAIIESYDADDPSGRVTRYDTYVRDTVNIEDGMPLSG